MEELTPIRQIKVNFGSPLVLSAPAPYRVLEQIRDEAQKCEDDPYDVFMADSYVWESSITPEQRKTFDALNAKRDAAEEAYNPKVHGESSKEANALHDADKARDDFIDSTGTHLCYRCSYYDTETLGKTENLEGLFTSFCCRKRKRVLVRPYSRACRHFITGITDEMLGELNEYKEACRKDPGLASFVRNRQLEHAAKRFAGRLKESPSTAFYLYRENSDYYEKLYAAFPLIMADTQYPSFPLFLEAYNRWEKDVIIKKSRGANGMKEITFSVSNEEFCPSGKHSQPTSATTSDN